MEKSIIKEKDEEYIIVGTIFDLVDKFAHPISSKSEHLSLLKRK